MTGMLITSGREVCKRGVLGLERINLRDEILSGRGQKQDGGLKASATGSGTLGLRAERGEIGEAALEETALG